MMVVVWLTTLWFICLLVLFNHRRKLCVLLLLVVALILGDSATFSFGNGNAPENKSASMGEDYLLTKKAPVKERVRFREAITMENIFPLYGSREERIFKPSLKVFYYRANTGFRLNVKYDVEGEDVPR